MALMVVIVSAIFWIVILLPERGPVEEVTVTVPEPGTVDCTAPVKFEATVRTNDRANVDYHWKGNANTDTVGHHLTFDKADSKTVETTLLVRGLPGKRSRETRHWSSMSRTERRARYRTT